MPTRLGADPVNAKDLLDVVNDIGQWKGNAYTLAAIVMERQRQDDAKIAENAGQPELAADILAAAN